MDGKIFEGEMFTRTLPSTHVSRSITQPLISNTLCKTICDKEEQQPDWLNRFFAFNLSHLNMGKDQRGWPDSQVVKSIAT